MYIIEEKKLANNNKADRVESMSLHFSSMHAQLVAGMFGLLAGWLLGSLGMGMSSFLV